MFANLRITDSIIAIKAAASPERLAQNGLLEFWRLKARQFEDNLRKTAISAIIMDYDGTVYAGGRRENAVLDGEMTRLLMEAAERGIYLGFASGRGQSLRDALRAAFPRKLWPMLYAAYQDGAECGRLDDDALPTPYDRKLEHPALARARVKLGEIFAAWPDAPTMRAENGLLGVYGDREAGGRIFAACCAVCAPLGLKVFHGGRMTDITIPAVSKRKLAGLMPAPEESILAMGDAGEWPGNDCELLATPLGVSVGSMGADPDCCWRVTEETGIEATKRIFGGILAARAENV